MPQAIKMVFVLPFESKDKDLLFKMCNEVLAKADIELKRKVGGWLQRVGDEVNYGNKKEHFASFSLYVNPLYQEEIRKVITKWWDHYAKQYNVSTKVEKAKSVTKNLDEKSNCFVATALFGLQSPEVRRLRNFRDTSLQKYYFGRLFIRVYYKHGPVWALKVRGNRYAQAFLRKAIRTFLKCM